MAIGAGAQLGARSYISVFVESSFGSFPSSGTATTISLEPISIGFKTNITTKLLDSLTGHRGYTKRILLEKSPAGTLEHYLHPHESPLLLTNALGGGIVSSSGSTGCFIHSITAGEFTGTVASLGFMVRKGDTQHFMYNGGRVNVLKITGTLGEPIKCSYDFIFKDSTQAGTSIYNTLSISTGMPFTFAQGSFRLAATEASLTSTAFEHVVSFELTINNNLVSDANARSLGFDTVQNLPPKRREIDLKLTQRWDTTSAWDRFVANTEASVDLFFQGVSIGANAFETIRIILPRVVVDNPDIDVPAGGDLIMQEVNLIALEDKPNTTTGRAIGITIINTASSY